MLEQVGFPDYIFPWTTATDSLSSDSASGSTQFAANGPSYELGKASVSFGIYLTFPRVLTFACLYCCLSLSRKSPSTSPVSLI